MTLIRCGGHFPGSTTAVRWIPGDPLPVLDRRRVAFMYSCPDHLPMKISDGLN